jgi:hypothetical protein
MKNEFYKIDKDFFVLLDVFTNHREVCFVLEQIVTVARI